MLFARKVFTTSPVTSYARIPATLRLKFIWLFTITTFEIEPTLFNVIALLDVTEKVPLI